MNKQFKISKNRGFEKPIDFHNQKNLIKKGIQKSLTPDIFNEVTSLQELNIQIGVNNMGSFKSEAENYEPKVMKNIADLKSVEVTLAVITETRTRDDGTTYEVKYTTIDGVDYRVPNTVISALKEILEEKPKLKTFRVRRTGTTKEDTRYTVIPLD